MAARGTTAKANVVEKIKKIFGEDYIGESSNKYYVWADDDGEKVQIAIALTCPKNQIESAPKYKTVNGGIDFSAPIEENKKENLEFTQDEKDTINRLMAELGL